MLYSLYFFNGTQDGSLLKGCVQYIFASLFFKSSINEKTFFYYNFSSTITQMKKQNSSFSMSTLFVELISIFVNPTMYFNFIFFILAHNMIMKWRGEILGRLDKH